MGRRPDANQLRGGKALRLALDVAKYGQVQRRVSDGSRASTDVMVPAGIGQSGQKLAYVR